MTRMWSRSAWPLTETAASARREHERRKAKDEEGRPEKWAVLGRNVFPQVRRGLSTLRLALVGVQ
jgi:hypothetical protein